MEELQVPEPGGEIRSVEVVKQRKWWMSVVFCGFLIFTGDSLVMLLLNFYYVQDNRSESDQNRQYRGTWTQALLQNAAFPILIPLFFVFPSPKPNTEPVSSASDPPPFLRVLLLYVSLGVLVSVYSKLYALAKLYVGWGILVSTQLILTSLFSAFINRLKFNRWIIVSIIFTLAADFFGSPAFSGTPDEDETYTYGIKAWLILIFPTLAFSLSLCLMQLGFEKVLVKTKRYASLERLSKVARIEDEEDEEEEAEEPVASELSMNPGVQRYLVAIEYIGTRFSGSQQQAKDRTVVGVLQEAFRKFTGQPVKIFCSSRTDAGVHALSNVCHIDVERVSKRKPGEVLPPHEPGVVQRAVNHFLQRNDGDVMVTDVRVSQVIIMPDIKPGSARRYFYRLLSGSDPLSILEKDRAWHVPEELDVLSMQEACRVLVGSHDFTSFRAVGCQAKSPVRCLDEFNVTEVPPTPYFPSIMERGSNLNNGDPLTCSSQTKTETAGVTTNFGETFGIRRRHCCYVVTTRARGFLYHQVRLLVGALKCVGTGELTVSDVERILEARTVSAAKPMAPASGLYLAHVKYELP
ncbi:hypothetical protein Bca52824_079328 [Brassica carinata]|uniref:Pseudouridine synthase I TruA alpha/beta domain-containing protein n=1 Tax=Brassica carinata TaxID=52824 RepID=A0A8X7Q2T1_BRACI|nr:hypothetical protein Bca52824_079328 [Brassica carinata]